MRESVDTLASAISPELESLGLELFDVQLTGSGRSRVLQILVDRDGGVDLEAITAATERISPVLDGLDTVPGPFSLEVSSPGLERTLRRPDHFRRAIGETISVKSRDENGEISRVRGTLAGADDLAITLGAVAGDEGGEARRIAYDDIVQARTVFEWGAAPKPGKVAKKVKT
jgi:ribosome maturation factor RimP